MTRGWWPTFLLPALLLAAVPARAEWVSARAERLFGAEVAEAESCRAAEERAKEDAIRQVTGERLSSEDLMVCTEKGDEAACSLNRVTWATVDGDIRAVRNLDRRTVAVAEGVRKCVVALDADVVVAKGSPDPSFDLSVALNSTVFRHGEDLSLTLTPSKPMSVAVFQWLPYESGEAQIGRIFPNSMDGDGRVERPTTIPTPAGARRYAMKVGFPAGQPDGRRMVDEYLMVVATRKPVDFLDRYSLDGFRARLVELPREDSRMVRKAYSVVRAR